jgi:hypothetical protein
MRAPAFDFVTPEPTLRYGAVHARACLLAVRQGVGRWGVYVLMAALLAGAGADPGSAVAALQALAAWLVLPLFWAVAQGPLLGLAGVVLHALAGAGLLLGARQWLWPSAWAEQERALPIPPGEQTRSDLLLLALALVPWLALCAGGAAVWLWRRPAWLQGHEAGAATALMLACAASLGAGLLMQRLRRRPWLLGAPALQAASSAASVDRPRARRLHWSTALLWLPLWRGVARRSGLTLALGCVTALAVAACAALAPAWAPWWLAAQALVGLVLVSRLNQLTLLELDPLAAASAVLPLHPRQLTWARQALAAAPLVLGLGATVLCVWLAVPAGQLRGARLLSWALCAASAGLMELRWTHRDPSVKAVRWLFMLILSVALGSEVWQ